MSDLGALVAEIEGYRPVVSWARRPVTIPTTTGDLQVMTGKGSIMQLVMEETTGSAAARFELWDGGDDGGEYIGPFRLAEAASVALAFPPHGLPFRHGLWLKVTTGSVAGAIHIGELVPFPMRDESWGRPS